MRNEESWAIPVELALEQAGAAGVRLRRLPVRAQSERFGPRGVVHERLHRRHGDREALRVAERLNEQPLEFLRVPVRTLSRGLGLEVISLCEMATPGTEATARGLQDRAGILTESERRREIGSKQVRKLRQLSLFGTRVHRDVLNVAADPLTVNQERPAGRSNCRKQGPWLIRFRARGYSASRASASRINCAHSRRSSSEPATA